MFQDIDSICCGHVFDNMKENIIKSVELVDYIMCFHDFWSQA
jgi:hypothetical protein